MTIRVTDGLTTRALAWRVESLQRELNAAQSRIHQAEARAQLAERSARDAWAFVKALRGTRGTN
jgi:hypothetical protein